MRTVIAFFISVFVLTANEPKVHLSLQAGSTNLRGAPSSLDGQSTQRAFTFGFEHINAIYTMSSLRKYVELNCVKEYGFSGSTYSYVDGGTAGIRLQYKYHDKSSSWSPFIGVSGQRSTLEYSGTQPMNNFGGTLGLAYHEHREHLFKIACFREFRRTPVASTTLSYDYEGDKYFGTLKFNATFGNPERGDKTKKYFGGSLRFGINLSKRFALYGYAEKFDYLDFLIARQVNVGLGIRAAL
ncbi:MAG TPA: hypothetical protein VJ579_04230 [Candidatus Paceibacterota bacterium]|nr:hypothetical protein [Candidatus Paceibacterota bacterium]